MSERIHGLTGVYSVVATPFDDDVGLDGLTILGVAGEAAKLRDRERAVVVDAVIEEVGDDLPVIVGISGAGTRAAVSACKEAERAGATGFMISPPAFFGPGPALSQYFKAISDDTGVPIVLQDFPPASAVTMTPEEMAELAMEIPNIVTIKLEDPPTGHRTEQFLRLCETDATVLGGLGGMYLLPELQGGSSGCMTGFPFPEILSDIVKSWQAGDREKAIDVYQRHVALMVLDAQPKLGLPLRKHVLRRRGWINTAALRHPGMEPTAASIEALDAAYERLGLLKD